MFLIKWHWNITSLEISIVMVLLCKGKYNHTYVCYDLTVMGVCLAEGLIQVVMPLGITFKSVIISESRLHFMLSGWYVLHFHKFVVLHYLWLFWNKSNYTKKIIWYNLEKSHQDNVAMGYFCSKYEVITVYTYTFQIHLPFSDTPTLFPDTPTVFFSA